MSEKNGRIKLPWAFAVQLAATLLAAGILIGKVDAIQRQVDIIQAGVPSVATLTALKNEADREHLRLEQQDVRLWDAIDKLQSKAYGATRK